MFFGILPSMPQGKGELSGEVLSRLQTRQAESQRRRAETEQRAQSQQHARAITRVPVITAISSVITARPVASVQQRRPAKPAQHTTPVPAAISVRNPRLAVEARRLDNRRLSEERREIEHDNRTARWTNS